MRRLYFLLVLALVFLLTSCLTGNIPENPPNEDDPPTQDENPVIPDGPDDPGLLQSRVSYTMPPSVPLYNNCALYLEQSQLPLYRVYVNNSQYWKGNVTDRDTVGVGYFFLEGKVNVSLRCEDMSSCVVRPLSANVEAKVENGVAMFTLSSSGNYSIEPNGDPTKAVFLFVSDYADKDVEEQNNKVIRFAKGLHTSANNPNIVNNTVTLASNTTVILEDGAVVRARFVANNASNITICGTGIIDGSAFIRNATTGQVTVPLDFNYCTNITFKDFSVHDPAGWCVNWYFCSDSKIDNIKIISSRSNGDGISLQSCQRIDVSDCFVRSWDDSLVVKNYPKWSNRDIEGVTRDITFTGCTIWTDLAQSMEIGYETVGQVMENITFEDITVLHNFHKPVISIHNGNNANIKNVTYNRITVEDASMGRGDAGANNQLIEISVAYNSTWSDSHKKTALGSIDSVTISNVTVRSGNIALPIKIAGCRDMRSGYGASIHYVTNVVLNNIWAKGKQIGGSYAYLTVNEYANATFNLGSAPIYAQFKFSQSAETLAQYTNFAQVEVN